MTTAETKTKQHLYCTAKLANPIKGKLAGQYVGVKFLWTSAKYNVDLYGIYAGTPADEKTYLGVAADEATIKSDLARLHINKSAIATITNLIL